MRADNKRDNKRYYGMRKVNIKRGRRPQRKDVYVRALANTAIEIGTSEFKVPSFVKSDKVVLSPVFGSKEQEKLFAKCAKDCMSTEAQLIW